MLSSRLFCVAVSHVKFVFFYSFACRTVCLPCGALLAGCIGNEQANELLSMWVRTLGPAQPSRTLCNWPESGHQLNKTLKGDCNVNPLNSNTSRGSATCNLNWHNPVLSYPQSNPNLPCAVSVWNWIEVSLCPAVLAKLASSWHRASSSDFWRDAHWQQLAEDPETGHFGGREGLSWSRIWSGSSHGAL